MKRYTLEGAAFCLLLGMACAGFVTDIEKEYIHLPGDEAAYDVFSNVVSSDSHPELEGLCANVACAYEPKGFVNGFRMGVRLMLESIGPGLQLKETSGSGKGGGRHDARVLHAACGPAHLLHQTTCGRRVGAVSICPGRGRGC